MRTLKNKRSHLSLNRILCSLQPPPISTMNLTRLSRWVRTKKRCWDFRRWSMKGSSRQSREMLLQKKPRITKLMLLQTLRLRRKVVKSSSNNQRTIKRSQHLRRCPEVRRPSCRRWRTNMRTRTRTRGPCVCSSSVPRRPKTSRALCNTHRRKHSFPHRSSKRAKRKRKYRRKWKWFL